MRLRTPRRPARILTFQDAVEVWRENWAGEIQSRIAAAFDTNQGRISEILNGHCHPGSEQVARGLAH